MIPIGFFAQTGFGSLGDYWMGLLSLSDASKNLFLNNVQINSEGRAVFSGNSNVNDASEIRVAIVSNSGSLAWQRVLNETGSQTADGSCRANSGAVLYTIGYTDATTYPSALLVKYDATTGATTWQKSLSPASGLIYGTSVAEDTISTAVYVVGVTSTGAVFAKYSSTGSITWQKSYGTSFQNPKIAVDDSGGVYIVGTTGSSTLKTRIVKLDSSGVIQWQKEIDAGDTNLVAEAIVTDSLNNVIITSRRGSTTTVISKYDSGGTRQWDRAFDDYSTNLISVDSSDSIYITGSLSGSSGGLITKIASNGTLAFQRKIAVSGTYLYLTDVAVLPAGDMYIAGNVSVNGTYKGFVTKLPADGSLTGTYLLGSLAVSYSSSSPTFTSVVYLPTTTTTTVSTSTFTAGTSSLTNQTGDLTFVKTA